LCKQPLEAEAFAGKKAGMSEPAAVGKKAEALEPAAVGKKPALEEDTHKKAGTVPDDRLEEPE
jgi:hypothetical protein